jgi:hypothetical protein
MRTILWQDCEQGDFGSEDYAAATQHEDETGHAVFGEYRTVPGKDDEP